MYFHGSSKPLPAGTILSAEHNHKVPPSGAPITNEWSKALFLGREAARESGEEQAFVYEVEPFGDRGQWHEMHSPKARVVRCVFGGGVDALPSPPQSFDRDPFTGLLVRKESICRVPGR